MDLCNKKQKIIKYLSTPTSRVGEFRNYSKTSIPTPPTINDFFDIINEMYNVYDLIQFRKELRKAYDSRDNWWCRYPDGIYYPYNDSNCASMKELIAFINQRIDWIRTHKEKCDKSLDERIKNAGLLIEIDRRCCVMDRFEELMYSNENILATEYYE